MKKCKCAGVPPVLPGRHYSRLNNKKQRTKENAASSKFIILAVFKFWQQPKTFWSAAWKQHIGLYCPTHLRAHVYRINLTGWFTAAHPVCFNLWQKPIIQSHNAKDNLNTALLSINSFGILRVDWELSSAHQQKEAAKPVPLKIRAGRIQPERNPLQGFLQPFRWSRFQFRWTTSLLQWCTPLCLGLLHHQFQ